MAVEKFQYDNRVVRLFLIATSVFGLVGMLVGILAAFQLYFPDLNIARWVSFGRIRPLHTNAIIFAFVGNGLFAGVYYSLQRLLKTRMFSDTLSMINFWGWQLIILAAAITLPLGISTGKEYAELEWPIDIAIALIWVVFGVNMIGTILRRRERHLYVAVWFYIATFVTVAMLHIVNSFELPISFLKSYSWYAGVQDALVQWWYGHNAVAFFLTTPYLGLMYYFIPKASGRPIYSYRLSIIHFWALIFIYIWAGPHHLLYTSLPNWAQSLGTVFSIMLIAPSWGGMLNGLLTLRGAWDAVRENPVLKFMVVAVTAYGMSTLEGPLLSTKTLNSLSHYTDWTIAHVHVGGLGWNGFLTFGMLYWLVPKMWGTKLHSVKLANAHFWIGTIGIILYVIPMYFAGFEQVLMWKQFDESGSLVNKNFLATVTQIMPMYLMRAIGGTLFFIGAIIMVFNLIKTAKKGSFIANEDAEAPALKKAAASTGGYWHRQLERRPVQFLVLSLIAVAIGGIIELVPTFLVKSNVPTISQVKPYTPLELHGRDVYIREGCYTCHSQMIRPFRWETQRYGEYSKAGEFVYDHPFQWGSKRTGPDLAREGILNPDPEWHFLHLWNPELTSTGSIMPRYDFLVDENIDTSMTAAKINAMITLGVPYDSNYASVANQDLLEQGNELTSALSSHEFFKEGGVFENVNPTSEMIALIAYLKRLGTDIKKKPDESLKANLETTE